MIPINILELIFKYLLYIVLIVFGYTLGNPGVAMTEIETWYAGLVVSIISLPNLYKVLKFYTDEQYEMFERYHDYSFYIMIENNYTPNLSDNQYYEFNGIVVKNENN